METKKKENAAAVSVKGKNPGHDRFEFRWVDRREEPFSPTRTCRRSHADPTADAAIGNIIREEKRRKQAKARRGKRPECRNENRDKNGNKKITREDKDAGSGC